MALSKAIKHFLENSEEPLSKRQKLAENAFLCNELQIHQREDLILNTICAQIPKQPKFWQTLQHCVDSPVFSHELKLKPENKQLLVEIISNELRTDSKNTKKSLKILLAIFKNSIFNLHFKNNLGKFAELIVNLFKFTEKVLKTPGELKILSLDCCGCALEILEQFAKDSKNAVGEIFVEKILFALANIVDLGKLSPSDKIASETHKLLQLIFFSKSNIPSYRDLENGNEAILFKIKDQISASSLENVFAVFTLISRSLIVSYKNQTEIIDFILRKFYEISGKQKLKIFNVFATYLTEIALGFDHEIENLTLNQFLEKVVDKALKSKKFSCTEYEVLTRISVLNPMIIEKKNQEILSRILAERSFSEEDKKWRGKFFEQLFEVTVRLRLEQKFVSWIFLVMKQKSLENVSDVENWDFEILGEEVLENFENHLKMLTSKHALNIFLTLLFHLKNDCLNVEENFSGMGVLTLKTITQFTIAYLRGVRIFDHTISPDSQMKFVSLLMELKSLLNLLLEKMLASENKENSVAESLLKIAFYWTEVMSLMKFYAPKSVDSAEVFPFSKEQLKKLKKKLEAFEDEKCQQLLEKLKNLKKKGEYFEEENCPLPKNSSSKAATLTREKFKKPTKNLDKLKNDDFFRELEAFLKEPKIESSQEILAILSILIHRRTECILGKLPPFMKVLSEVARIVIDESRNEETILEKKDFVVSMLEINKIVIQLIKLGKDTKRLCPFLLADLIFWYSKGVVPFYVKEPLEATIAQLFSVCDQHSIAFLSRCLPKGTGEIFKTFYGTFKKFHKFTGKI